jgi:hypothetical protein
VFDPARWNATLKPHWDLRQQLGTFASFELFYVQSLTPLLFLILIIATSPRSTRRRAWWNGWVVYFPALAGIAAYALVLVTARYVMPFLLAGVLTLLATLPRPRRMLPSLALVGVALVLLLEALSKDTIVGLALVAAVIAAMVVGSLAPSRSRVVWGVLVLVGFLIARILLAPTDPDIVRVGSVLVAVLFWFSARTAIRNRRSVRFAQSAAAALVLVLASVFANRFWTRIAQDNNALRRAASPDFGNVELKVARDLETHGVAPGTPIALIGPHAESYWARTGRLKIVASVPRTRASAFWKLSLAGQDSLLAAFASAGATVAIASMGPDGASPDSSWTPTQYHGWVRRLGRMR